MATTSELVSHEGLAPYNDGRTHQFIAHAQSWHRYECKDGTSYFNLLVYNVRIKGRAEIIDDHCWINDRALGRVLDTNNEDQRETIENRCIGFHGEVGIYYPKKGNEKYFGYCIHKVTHLHIVKEEPPAIAPSGGWRVQFLDDNAVVIAHDTASLLVSKCPSSDKLIARPCQEMKS